MSIKLIFHLFLALCLFFSSTPVAFADFNIATGLKWVPLRYTAPVGTNPSNPSDVQSQQLNDLNQEKSNLELNIRDLEKALTKDEAKNNPIIRDTLNDSLTSARNRLNEVNGQISNLNQQVQNSTPQISQPETQTGKFGTGIPFSPGNFQLLDTPSCPANGPFNTPRLNFPGLASGKDSVNWNGMGVNQLDSFLAYDRSFFPSIPINLKFGGGMTQIDPPQTTQAQNQVGTTNPQAQLDAKKQEQATLQQNIRDLEKGLKSDMAKDPLVRQSIEDNLKNAKSQLETVNQDISTLERQAQQNPQASSTTQPRQQAQGMTTEDAEKASAAFLSLFDANTTPDTFFQSYQQYLDEYNKMTEPQRQALQQRMQQYYDQQQRAIRMRMEEDEARRQRLEQLNRASQVREEQQATEKEAMRTEIGVMSQQILNGIDQYMQENAAHDPTLLKWVSVGAEMQHQTKALADSCIRDQFRAEAKLQAIDAWEKAHAEELKNKPYLQLVLINMRYAANTLKLDAEKVWLSTKELVLYGFIIDVATIVLTSMAKAVGVAKKLAEEAAMQAMLDAARKPTAYVVGEHMVDAAGRNADKAAEAFMGKAGQQAATQTAVQSTGQAAATSAVGQATGQQVATATATQAGDSVVGGGLKTLLSGKTIAKSFWLKINILAKGADAEINRLIQIATEEGISKQEIDAAGRSIEKLAALIIEKSGGKIVTFAEARPILEISVRVLKGTATQADREILEQMAAQAESKGVNFWEDLARQGTFGDDGFQQIATSDVVEALKNFVTSGTSQAVENTVKLAPGQAEAMAQSALGNVLDKTVQLSAEQANLAAREALNGAFDKTVQLAGQDAPAVADTIIDGVLDQTVKLSEAQIQDLIGTVVGNILDKTVLLTEEQAFRMADTVVENIVEHAAEMSEREAAALAQTMIEDILGKTVQLSETQIRNFINHVTEGIAEKTVKLVPNEADNLATTIMDNVLKRFTTGAENDAFRLAQTMLDEELAKTVQLSPSQAAGLAETVIDKALEKTTILSPGQASGLADTVLENILNKTTKMSFDEALRLADTVVDNIIEKSGTLSQEQAAALADTVIERILDKTVILNQNQAAAFAETVIGDVMAKTVQLSQGEAAALAETVIGDILADTVILSERQVAEFAQTVIDKTLVGTLKLSKDEAANLAKTVTENVLDRTTLAVPRNVPVYNFFSYLTPVVPSTTNTFKISDNESPRPQDRTFINYNYYNNVTQAETPEHKYDAIEVTLNKNFADNWGLVTSYRNAKLKGNFEGFFRNENGVTSLVEPENINVERTWAEVKTPVGRLDFGRMGSNWGTGVFNNNGNSLEWLGDEGLGELGGIGGPIIVNGLFGKVPGVMIYDNSGIPVGGVTRQQAINLPNLTNSLLGAAEDRSQKTYQQEFLGGIEFEVARSVSLGVRYVHRSIPRVLEDGGAPGNFSLSNVPEQDNYELIVDGSKAGFSNFTPQALAMPQLGMSPGDLATLSSVINNQLSNNVTGPSFWGPVSCCGPIYIDEPVFIRSALEGETSPNDPLYFNLSAKVSETPKKIAAAAATIGSIVKMGGVTLGAGEGSTRKKEPDIKDQWGLQKVGYTPRSNADSAWNVIDGQEKNVLIAVIDSGLDMTHPDGPAYIWTNANEIPDNKIDDDNNGYTDDVHGWNFIENNNDLTDKKGHGTFVAGIIAAKANNGIGIAGINPGAEIMMLKIADHFGQTNSLNIYRAIRYAVDKGAKIINISFGAEGISKLEQLAVNYAYRKGVLIVVAGGNEGIYVDKTGPSSLRRVLSVGALDFEGVRSLISNWGPNISLLAPGDKIYSLYSKDSEWIGSPMDRERLYYKGSGTSFSAPIVTATASLLLAKNPKLTNRDLFDILVNTADDLGKEGWDETNGAGVLNASKALRFEPEAALTAQFTQVRVQESNSKIKFVDVYGIVRGENFSNFEIELGKGRSPSAWQKIAGPYKKPVEYQWLCRISDEALKGSSDWAVRIKATDKEGKVKFAQAPIVTEKDKAIITWK